MHKPASSSLQQTCLDLIAAISIRRVETRNYFKKLFKESEWANFKPYFTEHDNGTMSRLQTDSYGLDKTKLTAKKVAKKWDFKICMTHPASLEVQRRVEKVGVSPAEYKRSKKSGKADTDDANESAPIPPLPSSLSVSLFLSFKCSPSLPPLCFSFSHSLSIHLPLCFLSLCFRYHVFYKQCTHSVPGGVLAAAVGDQKFKIRIQSPPAVEPSFFTSPDEHVVWVLSAAQSLYFLVSLFLRIYLTGRVQQRSTLGFWFSKFDSRSRFRMFAKRKQHDPIAPPGT
jgi:hypothetical protein